MIWNNSVGTGRISVRAFGCDSAANNMTRVINFAIRSLEGVGPASIIGVTPIPIGSGGVVFSVPEVNFPLRGPGDPNPINADAYQWEIPSGWSIISGGNTRTVTVQPNTCTGGQIRVRAVNLCNINNPTYSAWSPVLNVTRSVPQPGPITGPANAVCRRTTPVTYSVTPVSGATSYTWTLPTGWLGSSTTNSIQVTPDGLNGGIITVRANGCGLQSVPRSLSIPFNVTDPVNPPSISNATVACFGGSDFSVVNAAFLPSGTTFSWSHSSNLTAVSGQGTSTFRVRANTASTAGIGQVSVILTIPCGQQSGQTQTQLSFSRDIWVGPPAIFNVNGPIQVTASSVNDYTAVPWAGQPSFSTQGINTSGILWTFPVSPGNSGWAVLGQSGFTASVQAGSQSTVVRARLQNGCGTAQRDVQVLVECPTGDCEQPFKIIPPTLDSRHLTIEIDSPVPQAQTEVFLLDLTGKMMYQSLFEGKNRMLIPVDNLASGVYVVRLHQPDGVSTRMVRIDP